MQVIATTTNPLTGQKNHRVLATFCRADNIRGWFEDLAYEGSHGQLSTVLINWLEDIINQNRPLWFGQPRETLGEEVIRIRAFIAAVRNTLQVGATVTFTSD